MTDRAAPAGPSACALLATTTMTATIITTLGNRGRTGAG
jgi:hypothetical protein